MAKDDLWTRLERVIREDTGEPSVPPIEIVAIMVHGSRRIRNWKVSTLAEFAGVSVSTIERVERGEEVSADSLDLIGQAFGLAPGYYTEARAPLMTQDEGYSAALTEYSFIEAVPAGFVRTQADIRRIASCHAFLLLPSEVDAAYRDQVYGLLEWFDLTRFELFGLFKGAKDEGGRRKLYADVLQAVHALESCKLAIVVGIMSAPTPGDAEGSVAVISVSSKALDPGAAKRKFLFVDRRLLLQQPQDLFADRPSVEA